MASRKHPPAPRKNGMYGTPRNMGGRVQPRNIAFLNIVLQQVDHESLRRTATTGGGGGTAATEHELGDLSGRANQYATDQDGGHFRDALVRKRDLIAAEDDRNGDDNQRDRIQDSIQVGQQGAH